MDLKTNYSNTALKPIYAGSGAVATVSADGKILAAPVLDEINVVQLSPSKQILHTIENDDEQEITALKLSPNGRYLCYVSQAQLLKIFDVDSGEVIRSMKISSPSYVLDSDSTSTLLAVGGTDGTVTIVDIENGYVTHSLKGHGGTVSSIKFYGEQNGNVWLLASGDTNGTVKIWDLVKRRCLHTMQEHTAAVRGLDFRQSCEESLVLLLSGGRDDVVNYWEFNLKKKCTLLKTLPVHQQVESCGFVNEQVIYTAGGGAVFQLISLESGKVTKKTHQPVEELFIVGVIPIANGSEMYLVYSDQTLVLIRIDQAISNPEHPIEVESSIAGNHGTIADMNFVGPNFDKLALATNSPTLRIIPRYSEGCLPIEVELYEAHSDLLNAIDTTEDGLWLATASKDNTAILWRYCFDTSRFTCYAKFEGHSAAVTAVGLPNVMPKGWPEFLITASNDLTVKKWKVPKYVENGENEVYVVKSSEYTRRAHEKDINALSVAPNDSIFATASYDKLCKIWDLETGEQKATLANHRRGLWDVAFCQYDKLLATCSGDKTIKLWSLDNFAVVKTLEGHNNAVQKCAFINKQAQLVSSGADGLLKVWDCSTGECLKTLDGHANRIWALCTADDGDLVVSADADGVFQFWSDCTEQDRQQHDKEQVLKVEQEQSLKNYLSQGDWTNAFLLAITLDHPLRLFNVLKQSLSATLEEEKSSSVIFNTELDTVISELSSDKLLLLMQRCRDWNTNARTHNIAQKTIRCVLLHHNIVSLSEIPGMVQIVDAILPYSQRHFTRVESLVEQSYILDYALIEMDRFFN